jgi:ubiquinone/menaquinone biosynthesis C-methylase UbiE
MDKNQRYETDWIYNLEKEVHWRAYWLQQKILENKLSEGDSILEIGKGTGFCSNYLRNKGYNIQTIDIDPGKNPDIIGDIAEYDFPEKYDYILAFEVFEHIPFDTFGRVIQNLKKCVNKNLIFSIPEGVITLLLVDVRLPVIKHIRFGIKVQQRFLPRFLRLKLTKYHHWELNYDNKYSLRSIKKLFDENGLEVISHTKSHFNNHNFFVIGQK